MRIYTVGHSTRNWDDFIQTLKNHDIGFLIDIRKFPGSKKFPHFNKDNLEEGLLQNGIDYLHYPALGGFRKGGYVAFTMTDEFKIALAVLLDKIKADNKSPVLMCAEIYYGRCHRRYVADELAKLGYEIIHIYDSKKSEPHKYIPQSQLKVFCDKQAEKNNDASDDVKK